MANGPPVDSLRYLPVAGNSCLRDVDGERWVASVTIRIGCHHVAIRAGSPHVEVALRELLHDHIVDDPAAPASFGVQEVRASLPTARPVYRVYEGCSHIFTSRSAERAVAMVAGYLERLLPRDGADADALHLAVHAIVNDEAALLVPWRLPYRRPAAELRLLRSGLRQLERSIVRVDAATAEVCVDEPRLVVRRRSQGGAEGADGPVTLAGVRRIAGWVFPGRPGPITRAHAVGRGMRLLWGRSPTGMDLRRLAALVERVELLMVGGSDAVLRTARGQLASQERR